MPLQAVLPSLAAEYRAGMRAGGNSGSLIVNRIELCMTAS
jgi:hypothetical protein